MKHVVVAIIKKNSTEVPSFFLVSSKKDFGEFTHFFYPPGGHMEPEDEGNELNTLQREMVEELNVHVTKSEKLTDTTNDKGELTSWYICGVDKDDFDINFDELHDAGFFTEEEMREMDIWPATRTVFDQYIFHEPNKENGEKHNIHK
ncbi:MAG: NUDIX hydrolase [Candidatus Magasanikbacteria bacterium]